MPNSREECGDFASVQLRGDWEGSVVRSFKMAELRRRKERQEEIKTTRIVK